MNKNENLPELYSLFLIDSLTPMKNWHFVQILIRPQSEYYKVALSNKYE